MVETPPHILEWKKSDYLDTIDDNNIRCLPVGLGCNLQWRKDQRSMVTNRAISPHQLPRATGSYSCSPDIRKGEIRDFNTFASGQFHSCCLHQQKGGTVSPMLSQLTKDLWLWCMKKNILLQAQHLPGVLNTVADEESRTWSDRSEWMLSPTIFQKINGLLGPLSTDLFASRLSSQLPVYVSWKPDPLA